MAAENIVLEGRSRRAIERLAKFGPTKVRLDDSVDGTTREITRAYGRAWQVVRGEARKMAKVAAEAKHGDYSLSARDIARMDRVDRGLHALERQIRDLDRFAGVTILGGANRTLRHDVDEVLNTLSDLTGLDRRFTKPSGAAIEALVLRSTGRIEAATRRLDASQATALKDGLMRGLLYGDFPPDTARRIFAETEQAFFGGLPRLKTIARTEILDANRYAHRLAYNESELVVGWKWLAQLDARTCPACWAMHNTFHEKTEAQYAHQNCRCTSVPVLADDAPEDHDLGDPEEIFWRLPREEQLQIMGPGRLKALEAGVRFADLTHLKHNPDWRPAQVVTRVSDLQGLAELNVATFPGDVIEIPGFTNSSVMSMAYTQGGLTVHALTGEQPTSGYVVARQGTSDVIDAREFFGPGGPTRLAAWMRRHGDRLDEPGAHVGMWYDTANGKVVLDVVEILPDREAAIALGRAEDQIAIFDLNTFTEISTGGSGGYADPISSALGASDVGREAVVTRGDEQIYGTVVAAGEWGVRIKTSDGAFVNAAPDQFFFESNTVQKRIDRIVDLRKVAEEADHGIPVDYRHSETPESAKAMDDALDDLVADWPGIAPTRVYTRRSDGGEYASTDTGFIPRFDATHGIVQDATSEIVVNAKFAGNLKDWRSTMSAAEERGHFHRGTSDEVEEFTIDHEYGHVVTMRLMGDPRLKEGAINRARVVGEIYNRLMADKLREAERKMGKPEGSLNADADADPQAIIDAWNQDRVFRDRLTEDLSGYGSSDPDELMAEGFAVYRDHGPGESVAADEVMRALINAFVEQFGVAPSEEDIEALLT